ILADQEVRRLAVGVVGHDIEDRHPHQLALKALGRALDRLPGRLTIELDGTDPVRPDANDGGRDEIPAKRLRDQIRGVLPTEERAGWEVPERLLAGARLVNPEALLVSAVERHDVDTVRAPGQQLAGRDLAVLEELVGVARPEGTLGRRACIRHPGYILAVGRYHCNRCLKGWVPPSRGSARRLSLAAQGAAFR